MRTPTPRLDLGQVIGASFGIIGRRWAGLTLVIVIAWVPAAANLIFLPFRNGRGGHDPQALALYVAVFLALLAVIWVRRGALVAIALTPPAETTSVLKSLADFLRALPTLLPYLIVTDLPAALVSLWQFQAQTPPHQMVGLALASSVALGLYSLTLATLWGLIVPTAIVEPRGVFAALARSWTLLSGNRARFAALYVVMAVVTAVPGFLGPLLTVPLSTNGFLLALRVEGAAVALLSGLVNGVWLVMIAASYLELRRLREGVVLGEVSDIFG
jgi:hypothetical protein